MPKAIVLHNDRCIGCRSCESVCSLFNDGEINPAKSRISVITFLEGKYPLPHHFVSSCRQCADAPCLSACPVDAISRLEDQTCRIAVDPEHCIGCRKCIRACPFGAMKFAPESKKAYKCELCNGSPACAAICPSGAIEYVEQEMVYAQLFDFQVRGHAFLADQVRESIRRQVNKSRKRDGKDIKGGEIS